MNNVFSFNEFKSTDKINENSVIKMNNTYKVRTLVDVDTSLINAFSKKVKDETGQDVAEKWSKEELASMIANYVSTSFMNIENIPSEIVVGTVEKQPVITTDTEIVQEQPQTQVQEQPVQPVQTQTQVQSQPVQTQPVQSQEI